MPATARTPVLAALPGGRTTKWLCHDPEKGHFVIFTRWIVWRAEPFASCHSEERSDEESYTSGSELALSTTKG